jgi:hypothetical protein
LNGGKLIAAIPDWLIGGTCLFGHCGELSLVEGPSGLESGDVMATIGMAVQRIRVYQAAMNKVRMLTTEI